MSLPFLVISHHPGSHIAALVIFTIASVTDYSDGWFARRFNVVSDFGKIADPTADKILILAALMTFSHLGFYSTAWVMPIIVREVLVTFCRVGWLLEGKAAGAEKLGKVKFVFQVVLIYLSFAYLLALDTNRWQDLPDFCYMTLHIVLAVTVALTLISGVSFFSSNRGHFLSRTFAKYTSALGVGSIPFAPGTWGSLVGIGLACLGQLHWLFYASLFLAVFAAGYWAVSRLGLPKEADPRYVVVDEALGMMLALGGFRLNLPIVLAGFFLFRLFDVLKPFPLRQLEKIHGFWGILLDDLGAGIYTWLVLFLFFYML